MQQVKQRNQAIISRIKKEKSGKCLICLQPIYQEISLHCLFYVSPIICFSCKEKMQKQKRRILFQNIPLYSFYPYNAFMKSLIYRYKGCYDLSLAQVFLHSELLYLKRKFKSYVIVYPPSTKIEEEKRTFSHIPKIVEDLHLPILHLFEKSDDYKQASQSLAHRQEIKNHIFLHKKMNLNDKKVLIVDDIISSGNTIRTVVHLLQTNYSKIKKIEILIICYNMHEMSEFVERKKCSNT